MRPTAATGLVVLLHHPEDVLASWVAVLDWFDLPLASTAFVVTVETSVVAVRVVLVIGDVLHNSAWASRLAAALGVLGVFAQTFNVWDDLGD